MINIKDCIGRNILLEFGVNFYEEAKVVKLSPSREFIFVVFPCRNSDKYQWLKIADFSQRDRESKGYKVLEVLEKE